MSFQALASLIKQASSRAAEAESGAGPAGPPHGASPVATMVRSLALGFARSGSAVTRRVSF